MTFHIHPLARAQFEPLFALDDDELAARGALRRVATTKPGFPCRISLADAEPGEQLILAHFEHHAVATPFRASHAIYIRPDAAEARPASGEVPTLFRSRILSLRGFDTAGMMVAAELAEGRVLEAALAAMLEAPEVGAIHLHFAKPGCFAARVERAC